MYEEVIARKNINGKTQSLYDHLKNTSVISEYISHYPNISKLIAYLHDLGKLSSGFQEYIKNGGIRGSVIHSWQGAFLAYEMFTDNSPTAVLLKEILGFCVTAHHNRLDDGVTPDGTTVYYDKFSNINDIKYAYEEIKEKLPEKVKTELYKMFDSAKAETAVLLAKIKEIYKNYGSAHFALGLFVKYLFSCLVDADRLDAYLFDTDQTYFYHTVNWDTLIEVFENNISKFHNTSKIDNIRKSVSDRCKAAAGVKTGIYQLSVPTGGGKTFSSLRFALHHCKKYGKKRIIYVIPYLSIIEQTAKNLYNILNLSEGNDIIFEHHSNIIEPEDEEASDIRKLAASRWDSPIILTTMVQFMESVMSARSGKLRKFAGMADSVIIFDEIQSMPIKAVHCFNEVATFLSKILNTTIVLCSATQPTLETTQRKNLLIEDSAKLVDCTDSFRDLKRVTISVESEMDINTASDFVLEKAYLKGNCLVIVNTKKAALDIYTYISNKIKVSPDFEVLHLSTSMCPEHRSQTINKVKDCLMNNKKIICVSTQLIEAGVDISFSCVVRAMAGLDSIAQAAGRCNRNGENNIPQAVYTFPLKEENLDKLTDIRSGKEITAQIIYNNKEDSDLLDEGIMTSYYQHFFARKDSQMDYPTPDGQWIYSMLSENNYGKQNYKNRTGNDFHHYISHAFYSADLNFNMIDKNTKSIIVLYGEAENLLDEYRMIPAGIFTKEKLKILNKLQKYSISLYEWELKRLSDKRALSLLDQETGIIFLDKNYYSPATGVTLEIIQDNLIV